jgi:hypothetical protein
MAEEGNEREGTTKEDGWANPNCVNWRCVVENGI